MLDTLIFLVLVFTFAIGLFIFAYVIPTISNTLAEVGLNSSSEGAQAIEEMGTIGTVTMQRGFFLLFVGFIISTMISAFLVRTHPIFIFMYILFLGITVFLSTYLGNAYDTFSQTPLFATTLASQGLINVVMNNIVTITIGVGALSIVIVFAKFSSFRVAQQV